MSATTGIEWTDATWNPVVGCTKISQGCKHCYAKAVHDLRHEAFLAGKQIARQYAQPFETVQLMPLRLDVPLRRRVPTKYFVNSVSDLFHDDVPDQYIARVFAVMALADWHTFQVLTKRPERMQKLLSADEFLNSVLDEAEEFWPLTRRDSDVEEWNPWVLENWPLGHIWLGTSVENQAAANERIPELLATPAAIRFLSCEPLLGPLDFWEAGSRGAEDGDPIAFTALRGEDGVEPPIPGIDWVIVGGESGAGARPLDIRWVTEIVNERKAVGVAVFVKQLGAVPMEPEADWLGRAMARLLDANNRDRVPESYVPLHLGGGKRNDPDHWPAELRVRQWPAVVTR